MKELQEYALTPNATKHTKLLQRDLLIHSMHTVNAIESILMLSKESISKSNLMVLRFFLAILGSAQEKLSRASIKKSILADVGFTSSGSWFSMDRYNVGHMCEVYSILSQITNQELSDINRDIQSLKEALCEKLRYKKSPNLKKIDLVEIDIPFDYDKRSKPNLANIYDAIVLAQRLLMDREIFPQSVSHHCIAMICIVVIGNNLRYIRRDQFLSVSVLEGLAGFYDKFRAQRNIIAHANAVREITGCMDVFANVEELTKYIEIFKQFRYIESEESSELEVQDEEIPQSNQGVTLVTSRKITTLKNRPHYTELWAGVNEEVEQAARYNMQLFKEIQALIPGFAKLGSLMNFESEHVMAALFCAHRYNNFPLFDKIIRVFKKKVNINFSFLITELEGECYLVLPQDVRIKISLAYVQKKILIDLMKKGRQIRFNVTQLIIQNKSDMPFLLRLLELGYDASVLFMPERDVLVMKGNVISLFKAENSAEGLKDIAFTIKGLIQDYAIKVDYQYFCSYLIWYYPQVLQFFADEFLKIVEDNPLVEITVPNTKKTIISLAPGYDIQKKRCSFIGYLIHNNPNNSSFGRMLIPMIELIIKFCGKEKLLEILQLKYNNKSILSLQDHLQWLRTYCSNPYMIQRYMVFILAVRSIISLSEDNQLILFFKDNEQFKKALFNDGQIIDFSLFKTIMHKPIVLEKSALNCFDSQQVLNNSVRLYDLIIEHKLMTEDEIKMINAYDKRYEALKQDLINASTKQGLLYNQLLFQHKNQINIVNSCIEKMQLSDFNKVIDVTYLNEGSKNFLNSINILELDIMTIAAKFNVLCEIQAALARRFNHLSNGPKLATLNL